MNRVVKVCFTAYFPDGRFKKFLFEEETQLSTDDFQAEKFHEICKDVDGYILLMRTIKIMQGLAWIDCAFKYSPLLRLPSGKHINCIESVL